jgi:HEAT repeat protein
MKTSASISLALMFICSFAFSSEKAIPELIEDLAVEDEGNCTCNTACGMLLKMKDEAVPDLQKALQNQNEKIRYYAIRCLGVINTEKSRKTLIEASSNGSDDVRRHAQYALTWHPHKDAEKIYISLLDDNDKWRVLHAIEALGEIRSKSVIKQLEKIRDNPDGWRYYYYSLIALRKIESKELPKELSEALSFLTIAEYLNKIDENQLSESVKVINKNIEIALPDVLNIYLWSIKRTESKTEPNVGAIIRDAGKPAYPYLRIGLMDEDENISREVKELIEKLGWQAEFEIDHQ